MFIGLSELAGAIGIVLPMAANVAPWLSLFAAPGLASIMLLAVLYDLRRHEPPVVPAGLFLLALFVMIGRFPNGREQWQRPDLVARRSDFVSMGGFSFERRSISI
jgi:hypothetical protein